MRTDYFSPQSDGIGIGQHRKQAAASQHVASRNAADQVCCDAFDTATLSLLLAYLSMTTLIILALQMPCADDAWRFFGALG
jgi:hypothetical protein